MGVAGIACEPKVKVGGLRLLKSDMVRRADGRWRVEV